MLGRMQDWPLLVWKLIDHGAVYHAEREIVTQTVEGVGLHRTNWREVHLRSRKLAQALTRLGVTQGDRVGTLAWNTWRHVELWFGLAGMGAIAHTINPRLFGEQLVYIINHAGDRVLAFDVNLTPLVEKLAPHLKSVEHFIVLTDRAHMPASALNLLCYEELVEFEDGDFAWREFDELTPCGLCYTSGTTGNPKGVLYSHRSNVLHAFAGGFCDAFGAGSTDVILPIVPMFHANAWGVPFGAAAGGAGLVLNGASFDPATVQRLIIDHGVTITAGVPTVWLGLLGHLKAHGGGVGSLRKLFIGGSAAPPAMIDAFEDMGVEVRHCWGMTEMSPLGAISAMTARTAGLSVAEQRAFKAKQGRPPFGVEMKIVDDAGREQPRDGQAFGRLLVRGPWIVDTYFGEEGSALDSEGWFDTGDVATIDPDGFMQIVDRAKDVIKSGGEWISSIEIENLAVGMAGVAEAAVIGVHHPKWDERPLLVVVRRPGAEVTREAMLAYLDGKIAKWWMPDDVVFVNELPHTATGKIQKTALREQFRDYRLPTAA